MCTDQTVLEKAGQLNSFAMSFETAVSVLAAEDYLEEFCEFYEIRNRDLKLLPAAGSFYEAFRDLSGDDVWRPLAKKTKELFGMPGRVTVVEDDRALRDELEGPEGLAPFFFVFGLMFCEYEGFTLCFISGSNN